MWKRSNCARLPQLLTAWLHSCCLRTIAFCDFTSSFVKRIAPATKRCIPGIRNAAPATKNELAKSRFREVKIVDSFHKLSIWSFKHHPPRWDVTAPGTQNATFRTLLNKSLTPANVLGNAIKPSRLAHFSRDAEFLAPATRNAIWMSKNIPNLSVFSILTSKCASRHRHVQF